MTMGAVEFQHPGMLWLLPVIVLLPVLISIVFLPQWLARKRNHMPKNNLWQLNPFQVNIAVLHPLSSLYAKGEAVSKSFHILRVGALGFILSLLLLALADPVLIGEKLPDKPRQLDILFIVDTSASMLLRDYEIEGQPVDRMSMLKGVLYELIGKLTGNRLSVIVYGDSAYTLLPFSQDTGLLQRTVLRIETGMAGRFNAVGEAIAFAVREATNDMSRHTVLVLFTDMNSAVGKLTPEAGADLAAHNNLPLYTIAIGSAGYAASSQQPQQSLPRQPTAGLIYDPANLTLLKAIAEHTGARSYHATDADKLKLAIEDIKQREKNTTVSKSRYYRHPLYYYPLIAALVMLTAIQLLNVFWRRFE